MRPIPAITVLKIKISEVEMSNDLSESDKSIVIRFYNKKIQAIKEGRKK